MALNGASQASFAYDGDGARVSKTAGGATTYVDDTRGLTRVLQEAKSGNTLTAVFTAAEPLPAAVAAG